MQVIKIDRHGETLATDLQNNLQLITGTDKQITRSQFNKLTSIHTYGRGAGKLFIVCMGSPKENQFGFYPDRGNTTKIQALSFAYLCYLEILEGKVTWYGEDWIWGNRGIPLSYGKLGTW